MKVTQTCNLCLNATDRQPEIGGGEEGGGGGADGSVIHAQSASDEREGGRGRGGRLGMHGNWGKGGCEGVCLDSGEETGRRANGSVLSALWLGQMAVLSV